MAYSSSKQINDIASQYVQNVAGGSDLQYAVAGVTSDLEMAQLNNAWNAEQVQKQMDYETQMSNTAHQREVDDLIRAGLNPVLSAKLGGASTPSVSAATADTGATGTASSSSSTAVQAKVSRENAATQAKAQIQAASISASAQKYAADMAYKTAQLQIDNPNSAAGLAREALFGDSSSDTGGIKGAIGKAASSIFGALGLSNGKYYSDTNFTKTAKGTSSFKDSGISVSTLGAFNKKYGTNIHMIKQYGKSDFNIYFKSFSSYSQYKDFCSYFNLKPVIRSEFNKGTSNGYPIFNHY